MGRWVSWGSGVCKLNNVRLERDREIVCRLHSKCIITRHTPAVLMCTGEGEEEDGGKVQQRSRCTNFTLTSSRVSSLKPICFALHCCNICHHVACMKLQLRGAWHAQQIDHGVPNWQPWMRRWKEKGWKKDGKSEKSVGGKKRVRSKKKPMKKTTQKQYGLKDG